MKITQQKALLALGFVVLLANGERLKSGLEEGAAVSAHKTSASQLARLDQAAARAVERQAKAESLLALQRYNSGCIRIVNPETMADMHFSEGQPATDSNNGNLSLREGAMVCNRLGETAVVVGGVITDIKTLTVQDFQKHRSLVSP